MTFITEQSTACDSLTNNSQEDFIGGSHIIFVPMNVCMYIEVLKQEEKEKRLPAMYIIAKHTNPEILVTLEK
jgi:hypothetical protein